MRNDLQQLEIMRAAALAGTIIVALNWHAAADEVAAILGDAGLPTLCFKKVWKLCGVVNVRITMGHRPAQAQEEPAGWGRFSRFCLESLNFLAK